MFFSSSDLHPISYLAKPVDGIKACFTSSCLFSVPPLFPKTSDKLSLPPSAAEGKKRQGFSGGFGPRERNGGGHGRRRHLPPQVQRQATDRQGHPEDQTRLQHTLDDWVLLRALDCGKETRRSQKGALG